MAFEPKAQTVRSVFSFSDRTVIASNAKPDPTPEEIAAKCAEIRARWTPRQVKRQQRPEYVPRVFTPVEPERDRDL